MNRKSSPFFTVDKYNHSLACSFKYAANKLLLSSGDFGLIGLAVMGQNLILNAADHKFKVVAFNRTVSKVDRFLANEAKGRPNRQLNRYLIDVNKCVEQENLSLVHTPSRSLS